MERDTTAGDGPRRGCLGLVLGSVALVVMAPWVAAVRWWKARRRGDAVRVEVGWREKSDRAVASVAVDVPAELESRGRAVLVDTLVRVAESLSGPGYVYNLVYREPGEPECQMVAFGRVQDVASRLDHGLSHGAFEGLTQLWLVLPSGIRLGEHVDPVDFDPEGEGAGEALAAPLAPLWWAAVAFVRREAGVLWRVELHMGPGGREAVAGLLDRMRAHLEAVGG